jgi:glucose/arabinose dehydrogenase
MMEDIQRACRSFRRSYLCSTLAILSAASAAAGPPPTPAVDLTLVATLSDQVVHIASTGVAGDDRLFLVRKSGVIQIYDGGSVLGTPFLDIDSLVGGSGATGDERGLLSIAFHPNYASNGFFYVDYIDNSSDTVVARYGLTGDPNVADSSSALTILSVDQPANNHNGGQLQFGPDGYLYIGMGDGGSACDAAGSGCNAQKTDSLLGSMLRLDVDGDDFPGDPNRNYAIPPTNPFLLDGTVLDEIWAYGLRNPWRFSFDRSTGDLYIGDVGQSGATRREEIDFQAAASSGGENYGWPVSEGTQCEPGTCPTGSCPTPLPACGTFTFPIYEYGGGCAVTGGFVYRGAAIADLVGRYVFGDYCSGDIIALDTTTLADPVVADAGFELTSFGEDVDGELYVAVGTNVYQLVSAGAPTPTASPTATATPAPPAECPVLPAAGCRPAGKGVVKINDRSDDTKDLLIWKWVKGPATIQTELGVNPVGGNTSYAVCVYDRAAATPSLALSLVIDRAGDLCGTKPCFKAVGGSPPGGKGWKYKDSAATADGVLKMILKGGGAGKAKIVLKAKGADLPLGSPVSGSAYFNQDTSVVVQLLSNDGVACFESTFALPATKNEPDQFKDKH